MINYDHDATYVISALGDRKTTLLSLSTANMYGIPTKSLPLEIVHWQEGGNKQLPCNQVLNILAIMKFYNDWKLAIESSVPPYRIKSSEAIAYEEIIRTRKIKQQSWSRQNIRNVLQSLEHQHVC